MSNDTGLKSLIDDERFVRRNDNPNVVRSGLNSLRNTMTNQSEQESEPLEAQSATASSTSHNPLSAMNQHDQGAAVIGNSVVSDLMSVYENLTQSSTPQQPSSGHAIQQTPLAQENYDSHQHHHQSYPQHSSDHYQQLPPKQDYIPQHHHQQHAQYNHPSHYGDQSTQYYQQTYAPPPPPVHAQQGYSHGPGMNQMIQSHPPGEDMESNSSESDLNAPARSRKKRGSSSGESRGRKKSKASDGRWSKRFTWPEELHRDFVSAIFDVGLKHSSPSTIIEHMPKNPDITTERVKSHLQKYRNNRAKSKQDFMSSYENSLTKFHESGTGAVRSMADAQVAAHLTYTDISGDHSYHLAFLRHR